MADTVTVDESLEGKRVISSGGEEFGVVSGVRSGTVYVDLDPGLDDRIAARLGWDDVGQADYPLGADAVRRITDETVHLDEL